MSTNATPTQQTASRITYRRRSMAGQSAIIAVIVLFLLLFLATIFIAIVARNISNTRNAANTSAARRFADAGLNYVDKQLMESPEGADWRPIPDCPAEIAACVNVSQSDPDYFYLKPYNPENGEGGFTRVNFGSETGGGQNSAATAGGRSLIRVTYQPNGTDPLSRYIKLEAIGRVGQINPLDPTTYQNTEGFSQRVELSAYKAIGLNEYARLVTNRDNKPVSVDLGAPFDVRDRGALRAIPTIINGPVRVNAGLKFYGTNFITLNPYRGDAIEVSGPISLNNVNDSTDRVANTDPTQVSVNVVGLAGNNNFTANVLPSGSANFTTLGPQLAAATSGSGAELNGFGLVRDNPRGAETDVLPTQADTYGNQYQNLRSTPRLAVPTMDAATGPGGLTRYRSLTRESAPLDPVQVADNPLNGNVLNNAGVFGWGQGLYLSNTNDTQAASESLFSGYSARSDWLNPGLGAQSTARTYWRGDLQYVPPAVTIELTPRYIKMTRSAYDNNNGQQAFTFRSNNGGRLRSVETIVRYTGGQGNLGTKPNPGVTGVNLGQEYQGYPAAPLLDGQGRAVQGAYEGEYIIFAEGNIRIKGVAGGLDPQTGQYFKRHLTIVSNGTIYVDGNLLRDNILSSNGAIAAKAVQGQSTIALLAKQYIAVNTTQFLSPVAAADAKLTPESGTDSSGQPTGDNAEEPRSLVLEPANPQLLVSPSFAPLLTATGFQLPGYVTGAANAVAPAIYVRHRTEGPNGASALYGLNRNGPTTYNYLDFSPYGANVPQSNINLALNQFTVTTDQNGSTQSGAYLNERFDLPVAGINVTSAAPENLIQIKQDTVPDYTSRYQLSRVGIVPSDVRIEALMYAQEGSFFIIPGPWFNANPNDTYEHYANTPDDIDGAAFGRRYGEIPITNPDGSTNTRRRVNPMYPFYKEPQDIRITFCGAITENLPAEIADQGAWMEKWGWVPENYGSTNLAARTGYPESGPLVKTVHGPGGILANPNGIPNNVGNGIVYEFDDRALAPYAPTYSGGNGVEVVGGVTQPRPLRRNPYNPYQPLPFAPRLPVAPGFLYYGQPTQR